MLKHTLIVIGLAATVNLVQAQTRIEAFTSDVYPLRGTETLATQPITVEIYNLDAPEHLEAELSAGLSADPKQAEQQARVLLAQLGEAALHGRVERAYQAQWRAQALGIDRYPALVFDEGVVIYGLTDLPAALDRYHAWRQQQNAVGK